MSVSDEGDHLEAILNHREWDGQIVKYHCKWVGHDIDAATWEEASYIQSQCPQEVKKYWRAFKRGQPTNLETTRNAAEIEEKLAFLNDMKDWEEEVDCVAAIERAKRSGLTVYVIWNRIPIFNSDPAEEVEIVFAPSFEMELPHVGKHCALSICNALDFLPVTCPFCKLTFCGQHRLPHDHECDSCTSETVLTECDQCHQLFKSIESLKQHSVTGCMRPVQLCGVDKCGALDPMMEARCDGCDRIFCLKHRYPSSHACQSLNARDERKEQRRLAAQETIKKTFKPAATTTTSTAKRKTASKTSSIVELMKAKAKAKGNTSIPMASRLYLNVQFPKESNIASAPMFFDKTSSIGKVLDTIADACSIKNLNHCLPAEDGQRLDLYSEDMTLLEKSQSLAKILSNLDTIILERKEEVM
ncbi:AN1-type zinc finger protein 1 [Apophysomyces sp. BC1015]|nr:AN1-type zinc finger protein 1 [Apophysomyces sp. BC1015]KAG0183312.1 AN1-type zinc finger protein 1 [Apophysomyces sp. BC1021]